MLSIAPSPRALRSSRHRPGVCAAGLLVLTLIATPAAADGLLETTLAAFSEAPVASIEGVSLLSGRLLDAFYAERAYQLVWDDVSRIRALHELALASRAEGFVPEDFHIASLRQYLDQGGLETRPRSERIAADLILSDALLRYVHHHRFGKLDPVLLDRQWHDRAPVPAETLLADMAAALDGDDLGAGLAGRFPKPFWAERLKVVLSRYSDLIRQAERSPLPSGPILALGDRGPDVPLVRERLRLLGEEVADPTDGADPERFDEPLRAAVVAFQRHQGLSADGIVGPATRAALDAHLDPAIIDRIRINLERMRWLSDALPADYLFVDVTDYSVHLVHDEEILWSTRAIVGTVEAQTPMFRDTMEHLVFNPTWTVPPSLQKKMSRVGSDYRLVDRRTGQRVSGGVLTDHRRYRLVQEPGPRNALGRVKFMFPNHHAVYLHDTPSKGLFARRQRALSNGCVRVQDPLDLAERILAGSSWDRATIDSVVERGRTRYVDLDEPLPILLVYLTASADASGRLRLRDDIYARDPALLDAFSKPVSRARIAWPEPIPTPPLEPIPTSTPELMPDDPDVDDRVSVPIDLARSDALINDSREQDSSE
ncbi:MAG: murein L,D-transpeptidase [Sphingobacteriia bacterium]|nr:murein L,D-transpeptidase [Sphingobacteriia bacterium]NCC39787.1 murein L,D-transpeptidase [Gammaproteobacteria bacterium]